MEKEKKVRTCDTPNYTSSSDEECDDDDADYSNLFKDLDRSKVDKINELIDALNEKDRFLEKQEDLLMYFRVYFYTNNLVLAFTNTHHKTKFVFFRVHFCRITYSPPLGALS
jgi:hypothetical protein